MARPTPLPAPPYFRRALPSREMIVSLLRYPFDYDPSQSRLTPHEVRVVYREIAGPLRSSTYAFWHAHYELIRPEEYDFDEELKRQIHLVRSRPWDLHSERKRGPFRESFPDPAPNDDVRWREQLTLPSLDEPGGRATLKERDPFLSLTGPRRITRDELASLPDSTQAYLAQLQRERGGSEVAAPTPGH